MERAGEASGLRRPEFGEDVADTRGGGGNLTQASTPLSLGR